LPQFENNILNDGYGGNYTFYDSTKVLILPFNNGYMAEWKTSNLGEFWVHVKDFGLTQVPLSVSNPEQNLPFIKNTWFAGENSLVIQTNENQKINGLQIQLINSSGQQVFQKYARYQYQTLQTGELPSGLYIIEIKDDKSKRRYTQKLFKQ